MSTFEKIGRWWEGPQQRWYSKLLENLRSRLTWPDVLVGFCATLFVSAILIGFRYQVIPDYKAGQIADQDVRAIQDVTYEDSAATDLRRAEAEAGVPSVYQLDTDLIAEREKTIAAAFSRAREILGQNLVNERSPLTPSMERDLVRRLTNQVGRTFPPPFIPILLRQHFNSVLEGRVLKILDAVLRDGIVSDRGKFLKDQRTGIVIRDGSFPFDHSLADSYMARDLPAAREYLRQFHMEFSDLRQPDQALLIKYLEDTLFPTLLYNRSETESRRAEAILRVQPVELQIRQGQTIVRSGEQVTPNILLQMNAMKKLQRPRSLVWQFGGYFLLAVILFYSLWRYIVFYQVRHRQIRNHMTLMLVVIASELLTMRLATALADILSERFPRFHDPSILYYGIPFAFGALLITLLVDVNLGILSSLTLAILAGVFYGDINLAAYLIIGSLAGIYSIRQYKDRAAILKAGLTIGIVNILCLASLDILRQMGLNLTDVLDQFVLALLSGMLAAALASMLLPALEALFKIVTDIRLLELSNLNAPILRRLSVEAPGTYHHSLMVATLAEVAAESVGANSLLARVAAYYHDLGKLLKPEYFVENQSYGSNKHEEIPPDVSSAILASHVKDGLQLAKESGLPQRITDMIPQHHGTRVMTYFYQKAKDAMIGKAGEIDEASFRYPGPKPQSKEAAIIMMADSVEAASRTLSEPAPALVQGMIDRLIDDIVRDDQCNECDITLRDVQLVKESFLKILTGIFHHRIDYPGYDFKATASDSR
ncbi:MAG: HDIG domain-containing metalloprotein [Acidobacteriota bacterium]